MKKIPAVAVLACLALSQAFAAQASPKHFRSSHEHFTEYAAMASELFLNTEDSAQRNTLGLLAAAANFQAERAFLIMQMTDVLDHMVAKKDRTFVTERIQELKTFVLGTIRTEIKRIGDLAMDQENKDIKALGNLIVNELRVFERNTENL
jgi:opacity protein-like surface antigen